MTRRLLAFALALLLGFAQHAALAHAIGHHAPVAHHDERDHALHDSPEPLNAPDGAHANCALDSLYVQVLGSAGTVALIVLPYVAPHTSVVAIDFPSVPPATVLAAAPRGPPAATLPL